MKKIQHISAQTFSLPLSCSHRVFSKSTFCIPNVSQVTLKEKLIGTSSKNLSELEDVINKQADKGYRLHTISTTSGGSKGLGGGDRIQATMVFERIE